MQIYTQAHTTRRQLTSNTHAHHQLSCSWTYTHTHPYTPVHHTDTCTCTSSHTVHTHRGTLTHYPSHLNTRAQGLRVSEPSQKVGHLRPWSPPGAQVAWRSMLPWTLSAVWVEAGFCSPSSNLCVEHGDFCGVSEAAWEPRADSPWSVEPSCPGSCTLEVHERFAFSCLITCILSAEVCLMQTGPLSASFPPSQVLYNDGG